jgi:predicted MFS family arabinose efflux permease
VSPLGRYRRLLDLPGARMLIVSSLAGRMILGMSSLAVLLAVRASTGSFVAAGLAVAGLALAEAAASPVVGALVDRVRAVVVLLTCTAAQTALLVGLALAAGAHGPTAVLVVLAAGAGAFTPPVSACVRVLYSSITGDPAVRDSAYALDSAAQEIVWTTGPLLVGAVAALVSPEGAVLLTALVGALGTCWFCASAIVRAARPAAVVRQGGALSSTGLRALLWTAGLFGAAVGLLEVSLAGFAVHVGKPDAAGVLLAAWAVGSMVGGLLYGALDLGVGSDRRLPVLLALATLSVLPLTVAGGFAAGAGLSVLAGVCGAPVLACVYSLVDDHAPPGATAEAFTWNTAALVAGIAAGSAAAGIVIDAASVSAAFGGAALALAVAAALAHLHRARLVPVACPA